MKPRLLVVQGMHRSGTSVVTALCGRFGWRLPLDLQPGNKWNPLGYFESVALCGAHQDLLIALGRDWYDVHPMPQGWAGGEAAQACKRRLWQAVEPYFLQGIDVPLVIKDPRIALLYPLWQQLAAERGLDLFNLVVLRPVQEVAASLDARDSMNPSIGVALWWLSVNSIIASVRTERHMVMSYADVMSAREQFRHQLSQQTGWEGLLPLQPAAPTPASASDAGVVFKTMQHHKGPIAELAGSPLTLACDALYTRLLGERRVPADSRGDLTHPGFAEVLVWFHEWARLFSRHHKMVEATRLVRDALDRAIDSR